MEEKNIILFDGAEEEAVVLFQDEMNYSSIQKEILHSIKEVPEEYKDMVFENKLFSFIKEIPTPLETIKVREGADGREYEYFDEHYTNARLDALFPGWWTEEMKTWYDAPTQAYITTGYLMVSYTLPSGKEKIRKVYAVGGAKVFASRKSAETGVLEASQPEDRAIASFTRWKKLAGKQLGIGLDIYHQKITPYLIKEFEKRYTLYPYPHGENWKAIFSTVQTGKGARTIIKSMPTIQQLKTVAELIAKVPNKSNELWASFANVKSNEAELWINKLNNLLKKG